MLLALLRATARLPLAWYHALGAALGWIVYLASPTYATRLRENLRRSGVWSDEADYRRILRACIAETGRGGIEILPLWFRDERKVVALVRRCDGEEAVRQALQRGRGVILLTPHLGAFEIAATYTAQHVPLTVLYRPPKIRWLEHLIQAGRARGQEKLAAANVSGVRALYRALKNGEAVGILPDQAPGFGEGVWAEFFGRPAFTMTLLGRLQEASGAAVFIASARRLPRAAGYEIEVTPIEGGLSGAEGARRMNAAIEQVVRKCPEQYLWSYNRYKVPRGAPPPPSSPR